MCRLFAQVSPVPSSAEEFLVRSEFSLLKQSNFQKNNLQKDGWGLAYFGNKDEPVVSKSPEPVFKEVEAFQAAAKKAVSRVVIGHIRAASNPRGLPKAQLINWESSQPFTDGRWVFAHNGTLEIPGEVAQELGPLGSKVQSLNDSEVYFWQFVKFVDKLGDPAEALKACIAENWSIWRKCRDRYSHKKTPYTSLNAIVSDGKSLHVLCHAVRKGLSDCGVCNPSQPWSVMSFARRGGRLIVGSENLDAGRWTRFVQPEILSVQLEKRGFKTRRARFALERAGAEATIP